MARVTYVKKAQQRYEQVPVIDPATGLPKRTPVIGRNGQQKVTKHGRPVFMTVKQADKTKPLPPLTCEACRKPIEVGTPYKHVTPKSGPYGGYQRNRHADCPGWKPWDLSNAWWARIAQATDGVMDDFAPESEDDVQAKADEIAEAIRELAQQSEEAADNIEDGFGHETQQSQEARERAEALESWADEIEQVDIPEYPEGGECQDCDGTGKVENPDYDAEKAPGGENEEEDYSEEEEIDCEACGGTGETDEADEDAINDWVEECRTALDDLLSNSPV